MCCRFLERREGQATAAQRGPHVGADVLQAQLELTLPPTARLLPRTADDANVFTISRSRSISACAAVSALCSLACSTAAGRHRFSGERQSTPSISIDGCACVSITEPVASSATGQKDRLCSSLLVNRHGPVPSHYKIFSRRPCDRGTGTNAPEKNPASARPAPASPAHEALAHVGDTESHVDLYTRRQQAHWPPPSSGATGAPLDETVTFLGGELLASRDERTIPPARSGATAPSRLT